jgi:hypothetical protein
MSVRSRTSTHEPQVIPSMRSSHFSEFGDDDSGWSMGSAMGDVARGRSALLRACHRAMRLNNVSIVPGLWEEEGKGVNQ